MRFLAFAALAPAFLRFATRGIIVVMVVPVPTCTTRYFRKVNPFILGGY